MQGIRSQYVIWIRDTFKYNNWYFVNKKTI